MEDFLRAQGISKRYGEVLANDKVTLSVARGEIHSIVGENGAGKSTLMKILYGMVQPDEGEIFVNGTKVQFSSPYDALKNGIGMVHQHFMLVERMNVLENLILGSEPGFLGFIDESKALEEFKASLASVHADLNPYQSVRELGVGEQQRLEILKLLFRKSECLIFDEPTGVLTPQEVDAFLKSLLELKAKGKTILLITHKLSEVLGVSDRITVMRQGKTVTTVDAKEVSTRSLARLMVGREVRSLEKPLERRSQSEVSETVLRLKNVSAGKLQSLSLELKRGEILGVAGIEGNGQRELAEVVHGTLAPEAGELEFAGESIHDWSVKKRKRSGISFVPEDRHRDALILDMTLVENFYLGSSDYFRSRFFTPFGRIESELRNSIDRFEIRASSPHALARSLSGGNQQKVVISRELLGNPKLLIAAQPTRGVDVGAIERIHDELIEKRNEGLSILLFSCELDELLALSDRLIVLANGRKTGEFSDFNENWNDLRYKIGEAMVWHSS